MAETEDVLARLDGGVLTRHPLEPVRNASADGEPAERPPVSPTGSAVSTVGESAGEQDMRGEALDIYRQKLAYFEVELAKTADAGQRFNLEQQIEEIKAKLGELGG